MKYKKWIKIFLLLLGILLLESSATVSASMKDSKETKVAVELRRTISPDQKLPGVSQETIKNNSVEKKETSPFLNSMGDIKHGTFVKTGEIVNKWYSWLGVALVLSVSAFYYSKNIAKGRK